MSESQSAALVRLGDPGAGSLLTVVIPLLVLRTGVLGFKRPNVTGTLSSIWSGKTSLVSLEPVPVLVGTVC
jgi:hypothetical protein